MAKPNYSFEKRQRELQKKQKKEAKLAQRKAGADKSQAASEGEGSNEGGSRLRTRPRRFCASRRR